MPDNREWSFWLFDREWTRQDRHGRQTELARELEMSNGHVSLIVNGLRTPGRDCIPKIAEFLGRPVAAITRRKVK